MISDMFPTHRNTFFTAFRSSIDSKRFKRPYWFLTPWAILYRIFIYFHGLFHKQNLLRFSFANVPPDMVPPGRAPACADLARIPRETVAQSCRKNDTQLMPGILDLLRLFIKSFTIIGFYRSKVVRDFRQ